MLRPFSSNQGQPSRTERRDTEPVPAPFTGHPDPVMYSPGWNAARQRASQRSWVKFWREIEAKSLEDKRMKEEEEVKEKEKRWKRMEEEHRRFLCIIAPLLSSTYRGEAENAAEPSARRQALPPPVPPVTRGRANQARPRADDFFESSP
jgi:hypothetical protein